MFRHGDTVGAFTEAEFGCPCYRNGFQITFMGTQAHQQYV